MNYFVHANYKNLGERKENLLLLGGSCDGEVWNQIWVKITNIKLN
jgi:hypothetical protein